MRTPLALPGWRHVYSGKVRDLYAPLDQGTGRPRDDQLLLVGFVKRIRGEQKFDGPEELAAQLKVDEQTVLDLFEKEAK